MINKYIFDIDVLAILEALSLPIDHVLKHANLDKKLFQQTKTELTAEQYFALWKSLETNTDDPLLSIKLGQSLPANSLNTTMIVVLSSENLRQALQRLSEFKNICAPIKIDISHENNDTKYLIQSQDNKLPIATLLAMTELVFITYLARLGTAEEIIPTNITSTSPLKSIDSFQAYFGIFPSLNQENSISFSNSDLSTAFVTRNDFIWKFYEPILRNQLSWMDKEDSYENRVKRLLTETLPSGNSSLARIADKLALSERSLQRHLKKEKTNYQILLSTIRHELSRKYLTNSDIPSTQIAYLLGYKDANSFYRAFNLWQGQSPEEYRRNNSDQ